MSQFLGFIIKNKKINVGGQAVVEGVMIRGPNRYVVAVRSGKKILTRQGVIKKKGPFFKLPIIRGFVNLVDMLVIGTKSIMWSAEHISGTDEKITKREVYVTLAISLAIALAFFKILPYLITVLMGFREDKLPILFNFIDGLIRIGIFLLYLVAISYMKDIKVLFQYHGAEHKAIHCYEHGHVLSVPNVKKFTTIHPRCGTSFLIIVFVSSMIIFSILPLIVIYFLPNFSDFNTWSRAAIMFPLRILFIPLIAGVSYEILKLSDKKQSSRIFKIISLPGLLLQKITTKQPTTSQIEIAIHSLKKLVESENKK